MTEGDSRADPLDCRQGLSASDRGRLFARHQSWLRTVISSRLSGREDVEDVLQEVAAAAAGSLSPPAADRWTSWLYRIAVRQILLFRRSIGRRRRREAAYDPLQLLIAKERIDIIRRAVGRLPRRDAEVILLKYIEGWRYRDIAERLGTTEGAVEDRLHRIRKRLRAELARLKVIEGRS